MADDTLRSRPRFGFCHGNAYGLGPSIVFLDADLAPLSVERTDRLEKALHEVLLVPEEFWETVDVPEDQAARILCLTYLAICAHWRQIIRWRAIERSDAQSRLPEEAPTRLALPYRNAALARALLAEIVEWLSDEPASEEQSLETLLTKLGSSYQRHLALPVTKSIVGFTALRLGYPIFEDRFGNLVIGEGKNARTFNALHTDRTSAIGMHLCASKLRTADRLQSAGLPTAPHRLAGSEQDAAEIAQTLGFPVVVKPADQEQGRGVANNLGTPEEVRAAWLAARKVSERILVEKHVEGFTHRLTVVEGEVVSVVRRRPGGVVGDGTSTVADLVVRFNAEPAQVRRSQRDGGPLLSMDREAVAMLAKRGLSGQSVIGAGEFVALRAKDNRRAGGTNEALPLDRIHPDNLSLATHAAQSMLVDIGGIDLILGDISASWREQESAICEVNCNPELGLSATSAPFEKLLQRLVGANPEHTRIPLEMYVMEGTAWSPGERPDTDDGRWYCDAAGLYCGSQFYAGPFSDGFSAARIALANRAVDSLAMAMSAQELLQSGLPSAWFDTIRLDDRLETGTSEKLKSMYSEHAQSWQTLRFS